MVTSTTGATDRFVDSNVFVYALDEDPLSTAKRARARQVLADRPESLAVSTQVLAEVYIVATRKLARPLSAEDALRTLRALCQLRVVPVDQDLVLSAAVTSQRWQLSLWDAQVVEAARAAGCRQILTEDLDDGAVINGIAVVNPFRDLPRG